MRVDALNGSLLVRFFALNDNVSPWRSKPLRTPAPPNEHGPTPARVLLMALALRENPWKLGVTTGPGQKPRERTVAAGELVCWADVVVDEANSAVRVRREMEQRFAAQPDMVVT